MAEQNQIPQSSVQPMPQTGSPQQTQPQKTNPTTTHSISLSQAAWADTASYETQLKHHTEVGYNISKKYASIDSLDKSKKIEALKNPSLNPFNLASGYDGLANSFERWKAIAADADSKIKSGTWDWRKADELKDKVAENYYDKMIAPLYQKQGLSPMKKELWLKQAYGEALNYNIHDAYNNSVFHQLRHGFDAGLASTASAYGFMTNAAGHAIESVTSMAKNADKMGLWHEQLATQHNDVGAKPEKPNMIAKGAEIQHDNHQFWADALPDYDGWFNHATSFVTEQVGQAPIYAAMMLGGKLVGAAPGASNLTKLLTSNPIGKKVLPYLMAGSEGLAYGTLSRPQGDRTQAWKDAVGFAAFHGLFQVGEKGLMKLMDAAQGNPKLLEKLKARQDAYELAQEGKRPANATETYEAHKAEVANNIAVVGVAGQRAIMVRALAHVDDMQHLKFSREEIRAHELKLLEKDPAYWAPVLSSAKYIRALSGDRPISEFMEGGEAEKFLSSRLGQLIVDSASEMNTHVQGIKDNAANAVEQTVQEPGGKKTLDFYKAKVAAQLGNEDPAALKMLKPEQLEALAKKAMTEDSVKAAKLAEQKLNANPVEKATNVAKKVKTEKPIPQLKVRSERTFNKFGEPSIRYSVNSDYKVQLKTYMKEAKASGKSLDQFFEDMSDEDFNKDLSQHFFPKALKDAEIYFEKQHTPEGDQNPNFLGFMYNYTHMMPKEFGKALENRLVESMKVQKYMNGKKPTVPQLMYFARAMYNHVDNFLGSGRWPTEHNIFRSTQDKMWQSTEWQQQLLREKITQERKNIRDMFSSDPKAQRAALVAHTLLNRERMAQYEKGPADMLSQEYIRMTDNRIADLQTESGDYERIPF